MCEEIAYKQLRHATELTYYFDFGSQHVLKDQLTVINTWYQSTHLFQVAHIANEKLGFGRIFTDVQVIKI